MLISRLSSGRCLCTTLWRNAGVLKQSPPPIFGHRRCLTTRRTIVSGIQPTGVPHLGNWLGALRTWKILQDTEPRESVFLFFIADLHAITVDQVPRDLEYRRYETLAALLAIGLDPDKCAIFFQSDVPQHTELMWLLSCFAPMGHLSRMTQWKSKTRSHGIAQSNETTVPFESRLGLFVYPVLQAADILLYGTTHVPVGHDQSQHLEFTRHCATVLNAKYQSALHLPETLLSTSPRIMSLKAPLKKMSKSDLDNRSKILIDDTAAMIESKIKGALTDSLDGITYDRETRPGVSNLLDIFSSLETPTADPVTFANMLDEKNVGMGQLKKLVSTKIVDALGPIRSRYLHYTSISQRPFLEAVAYEGAKTAKVHASATLSRVKSALGLSKAKQ